MEKQRKYEDTTAAVLKADQVKRLYEALESEETPFEARVQKIARGERLVTINAEPQYIKHFTDILNNCRA